jgi:pimeloyl-ACP methyl ester carboxylesterase
MDPIRHIVRGAPGGRPVVFVHGFGCGASDWDAQAAHLGARHRTVAVDLRGHTGCPGPAHACSIELYGADVARVMDALDLSGAVVVGHSMGCRVAVEAALQVPARVAGIVLVDGSQFPPEADAAMRAAFDGPGGFAAAAETLFVDMFTAKSDPTAVARVLDRARALPAAIGRRMLLDLIRYDAARWTASLGCVRVPLLAIQSTKRDAAGKRAVMARGDRSPYLDMVRAAVPAARVEIVPDTGHFPQLDEPAAVNAALDTFLASL